MTDQTRHSSNTWAHVRWRNVPAEVCPASGGDKTVKRRAKREVTHLLPARNTLHLKKNLPTFAAIMVVCVSN